VKRIFAALLLLVAACGDDAISTTIPATTSSEATTTTAAVITTAATTVVTTTTAATTTSTVPAPAFGFFVDGLGVVDFGASPESVAATLTSIFGAPTIDTGWIAEPICPPPLYRMMNFGSAAEFDLTVIFTTAEFFAPAGTEQFFGYSYHGLLAVPVSPPALDVGTTVAQLQALYPGVQITPHELIDNAYAFVVTGNGYENVRGALTGPAAGDTVTEIRGGGSCGE
jgi:hypothetical protein